MLMHFLATDMSENGIRKHYELRHIWVILVANKALSKCQFYMVTVTMAETAMRSFIKKREPCSDVNADHFVFSDCFTGKIGMINVMINAVKKTYALMFG